MDIKDLQKKNVILYGGGYIGRYIVELLKKLDFQYQKLQKAIQNYGI